MWPAPAGYRAHMPVAIVTGSDSGIGRATAVTLARDGCDMWHTSCYS